MGSIILLSDDERNSLDANYKELVSLANYFNEVSEDIKIEYWVARLTILLFIDLKKLKEEFTCLSEDIKKNVDIKLIMADCMSISGEDDETALNEYLIIYKDYKSTEVLVKVLTSLILKENYNEIIELVKGLTKEEFDSQGRIASIYLDALFEYNGADEALEEYEVLAETHTDAPFLYFSASKLYYAKKDIENVRKCLVSLRDSLKEDNFPPRIQMSMRCYNYKEIEIAIQIVEPLATYSMAAQKYLVNYLLELSDESKVKAERLIDELITSNKADYDIYEIKSHFEFERGELSDSLNHLELAFRLKNTVQIAHNILLIRVKLNKMNITDDVFKYACSANVPSLQMMVATVYNEIGRKELVDYHSFKALLLLNDVFDENSYMQFMKLILLNNNDGDAQVDFEMITTNQAIKLVSEYDGAIRRLCIHSEKDLIDGINSRFAECEHYTEDSEIAIILKHRKINDKVRIEGQEYIVNEIIDRKARFVRYCTEIYSKNCPDSNAFKTFTISADDPMTPIIPILNEAKMRVEFILGQYNFENGIGLPLYALSRKSYKDYVDAMYFILNKEKQSFYAGVTNNINLQDRKVVVTYSSLLLLNIIGKLECLDVLKEQIYIPNTLKDTIEKVFVDFDKFDKRSIGSLYIGDDSRPYYAPLTEEEKENRFNFNRDLVLFVRDKNIKVLDVVQRKDNDSLNKHMRELAGNIDLDCIYLAEQVNGIIISDDLFVRKMLTLLNSTIEHTNCISLLIEDNTSINALLDTLVKLSKAHYHLLISEYLLYYVTDELCKIPLIYGEGTPIDKIKTVIRNQLVNPILFKDAFPILSNVINTFYNKKNIPIFNDIMIIIIDELKFASKNLGVNVELILNYILSTSSKLDVLRMKFFKQLFN